MTNTATTENPALVAARKHLWAVFKDKSVTPLAKAGKLREAREAIRAIENQTAPTPPPVLVDHGAAQRIANQAAVAAALAKTAEDGTKEKVVRFGIANLNMRIPDGYTLDQRFALVEKELYQRGCRAPLMRSDEELSAIHWRPERAGSGSDRLIQASLNELFKTTYRKVAR